MGWERDLIDLEELSAWTSVVTLFGGLTLAILAGAALAFAFCAV